MLLFYIILLIFIIILILLYFYGYNIENGYDINFEYKNLYYNDNILTIDKCKNYLNFKESLEPYLIESAKKEIIFQTENTKTDKVFYVIHGFNANKHECYNVSINLANLFKYNCYFTRMPDHGIYNTERTNNTYYDYLRTVYNDLIICSLLGDEIIIISASTGSTYSIIASIYFGDKFKITDNIMFSPNIEPYGITSLGTKILASGYGNFLINLTTNRIYNDNYIFSSNIFKPIIGSLKTLRNIKNKFINNFIIFTGENDTIISNNDIKSFYNNVKSNKKHLYIIKNEKTHPINKVIDNIILDKVKVFFNSNQNIKMELEK